MSREAARSLIVRGSRLIAIAILIGWSITQIGFRVADWSLSDMDAYWNAAVRLRESDLLYPPLADASAPDVYRYSPWFAAAWVPLTLLPKSAVAIGWSFVLIFAVGWSLRPLLRPDLTSIAAAIFMGSFLVWGASVGNIQPLMIAVLMHGIDRRSGPIWIGAAASLKVIPILFVLVYVGRREWGRAALATIVVGLLASTAFLVDLSHYPVGPGDAPSPLYAVSPILMGAVVLALGAITIYLARARSAHDRLSAAVTALAALPRITLLDLPLLLVGVRPHRAGRGQIE